MNITELARKLKVTPKELKKKLPELGFHIGPRAIQIPNKQAEKVIEIWQEKKTKEKAIQKIKEKISQAEEKKEAPTEAEVITIPPTIQVYRLADKLNLPLTKVMSELIKNGVLASVNENLDYEIAAIVAENLGFKVVQGELEEEKHSTLVKEKLKEVLDGEDKARLLPRPPVVVVMGHVDHGKTLLLDSIRQTRVIEEEAGGITQNIGAYQVKKNSHLITFIDTPGHEAFQAMRTRGGEVADIAILVIAADDKIQPQTLESIKIIQQENLPFIVAINKIDKPEADIEKIKKGLSEVNLIPEDWGGKVICVPVSAKTKKGIDNLLEMIILVADLEKERLVANPDGEVVGTVIETHLDPGAGPIASLIIYNGTLKKAEQVIVGQSYGRIKSIKNQLAHSINEAGPGLPVQIFGLKGVPQTGDILEVVSDNRIFKKRIKQIDLSYQRKVAVDRGRSIEEEKKEVRYLNIVLRTNVLGSLEAVIQALEKMEQPEVKINILKKGLGNLTESDIDLAKTTNACLISFNVDVAGPAKQLASDLGLKINTYQVIYELIQDVKEEMNKLLKAEIIEEKLGKLEVLAIFRQTSKMTILGGRVTEGKVLKDVMARIWDSKGELKGEGKIGQLQINKQDVSEAKSGTECGIRLEGRVGVAVGDILEIYQEIKKEKKIL